MRDSATIASARDAYARGAFERCLDACGELARTGADRVEAALLRARAFLALNRADRALDTVRGLQLGTERSDEAITARMLEGAALVKLGRLTAGTATLEAALADAGSAHRTIRAEAAVHLGTACYRAGEYTRALELLESVPDEADIIRARALTFIAWVALDTGDLTRAADGFAAALSFLASCRQYDRFIEVSALYGLAFLCAEIPRLDLWPALRKRIARFDWDAAGVAFPQYMLAISASYVTEMIGEHDEAQDWAVRAQRVAPMPSSEIGALLRLAALMGCYRESRGHAYFTRRAQERYDAVGGEAIVRDDPSVPLALAEELVQGRRPRDAAPLLAFHSAVVVPRLDGSKDARTFAAFTAWTEGIMEHAGGRRPEAIEKFRTAFERYDAMGFRRRAAIAAYRLTVLTKEQRYRAYVDDVLREASPQYWVRERLAAFGVHDVRLSERHAAVLALIAAGKSNKEIGAIRGGSWYTARNIVRELIGMFGVRSRSELVRVAMARGIVADAEVETA